jgi:two-component system response regulator HydG
MSIRKIPTVLVVDDDAESRTAMLRVLEAAEYKTLNADNGQQALDIVQQEGGVDVVVTDLRLPVLDGVELLKRVKAADQEIEVILITGYGTVEVAVEAIKEGAYDFITKPVKKAQLLHSVEKASEKQYLARENKELRLQLSQSGAKRFVYASAEMRNIARDVEQVASSTATVLITGESGTGKGSYC